MDTADISAVNDRFLFKKISAKVWLLMNVVSISQPKAINIKNVFYVIILKANKNWKCLSL